MQTVLLIFLGGGLGSVLRYVLGTTLTTLSAALAERLPVSATFLSATFPVHTLCINVLGSGVIGVVVQLAVPFDASHTAIISHNGRMLLAVGFCGGFTTFSTFSLELLMLLQAGKYGLAALYVLTSVAGCLLATAVGVALVAWWSKNIAR